MKELIGNTPLLKINYKYKNKEKFIYAKLEYFNLTGSIKDRIVYYILNKEKLNGNIKEFQPIIEATSGNTGISISAICSYYKHPVFIFMPDWVSEERVKLMKLYGANVNLVSSEEGGFEKCLEKAEKLSKEINGFYFNQFGNEYNILAHYKSTGVEIVGQLKHIDGFISGVGSGGTIMGVGKRLKEYNDSVLIYAIEPENAPIISNKVINGNHKIEGIGDEFIPDILDTSIIDDFILINDNDAIIMSQMLSRKLGLGVGISSGANFLGSIIMNNKINGNIVTVFTDDNKKYLSTDLTKDFDKTQSICNDIELLNYEVII